MYIESLEIKKNKELKPCPFCGSNEVVLEWYIHHADQHRVRCLCTNCMAMVDAGWWQNERQPIQAWNTRANEKV